MNAVREAIPLIRGNNQSVFRSGQWARITGISVRQLEGLPARVCFDIEFLDGAVDAWPVEDLAAEYEFSPTYKEMRRAQG